MTDTPELPKLPDMPERVYYGSPMTLVEEIRIWGRACYEAGRASRAQSWRNRLVGREYGWIDLSLGYPPRSERHKHIHRPYLGYEVQTITHPHFGDDPVDVFAIRVNVPAAASMAPKETP